MIDSLLYAVGYIVAALAMADLVTGAIHWFEDRYAKRSWPVVGEWIAAPNELHHAEPRAFLENGYFWRNSTTLIPCVFIAGGFAYFGCWWWLLVTVLSSQANEIHALAHRGGVSTPIKILQESGIFQSARHHAAHHVSPFATHFCIMTNWLNPLLDRMRFWRFLEWILLRVFRMRVKV